MKIPTASVIKLSYECVKLLIDSNLLIFRCGVVCALCSTVIRHIISFIRCWKLHEALFLRAVISA